MNITTDKLTEVVRKHHTTNPSNRDVVVSLHLSKDGFGKIEIFRGYLEPESREIIKNEFSPLSESEVNTHIRIRNPKSYLVYFAKPKWTKYNQEPFNLQGHAYVPFRKDHLKLIETSYVIHPHIKREEVDYKNYGEYNEEHYCDIEGTVRNIFSTAHMKLQHQGMSIGLKSLKNWNDKSIEVDFIIQRNLTTHFLTDIFKILGASDYASSELKDSLHKI